MKIVVGLGNPGIKYKNTRHNIGFMALDFVLNDDGLMTAKPSHEFKSEVYTWQGDGDKIMFLKPQTYMNDSGQALKVVCNFFKIDLAKDLLVIHDEVDLPLGTIKLTASSSDAGHNGVKSIIENLGTQNFHRLRIGIESRAKREDMPTDAFVLEDFTGDEMETVQIKILPEIAGEIKKFIA